MNRAEMTRRVLLLEAVAAQLEERAKTVRSLLEADARAEFAEQGTAPTWRMADVGTWSLPVSREAAVVTDPGAFTAWVKRHYPSAVIETVVPAFQVSLLAGLYTAAEYAIHPDSGEIVPGLGVWPGGEPLTLRFRAASDAQAVADQHADALVGEVLSKLGITDAPD